jgi:hypothetical protein
LYWHAAYAKQTPSEHMPLAQSLAARQGLQAAHGTQSEPPQSTPVSSPSRMPSWQPFGQAAMLQPGSRHFGEHTPPVQLPLWQSRATEHRRQSAHGRQVAPPQSTSLSSASSSPLLQRPPAQRRATHEPVAQSESSTQ